MVMQEWNRVLIIAILFSAVFLWLAGCGPEANNGRIEATGTIEMTETEVATKIAGRVMRLMIGEGEAVREGDLLAELDHAELDAQIAAARANLELARERYRKTSGALALQKPGSANPARQAQIKLAEENLAAAKAGLDQAEQDYQRFQKLLQQQVISPAEFEQATTRRKVAQAQYQAALSQLEVVRSSANTDDIELADKNAQTQIAVAQANLDLLLTQLANARILAPSSGVISARLVEIGEVIGAGSPFFTLLDTARPWVKIYLPLKEVERVALNREAGIMLDAFPNHKFTGRISFISREAEFTPKNYQSREERVKQVYAVKIEVEDPKGMLKAGLPVDVIIEPMK
jgi:HlyD family secretion protein